MTHLKVRSILLVLTALPTCLGGISGDAQQVANPKEAGLSQILAQTTRTLSAAQAVRYKVERIAARPDQTSDSLAHGTTSVFAATSQPMRYEAKFWPDNAASNASRPSEYAVSDGTSTHTSDEEKLSDGPARAMMDRPSSDALPTLAAFTATTYQQAEVIYAGRDDVAGDLCNVIGLTTVSADQIDSKTTFIWLSIKTGLPRSLQMFRIIDGKTVVTDRWMLSDIELESALPQGSFGNKPAPADSALPTNADQLHFPGAPKPQGHSIQLSSTVAGRAVPDFEMLALDGRRVKLTQLLGGKPAIITLWASWCAPCIAEMPLLESALQQYGGRLKVVAIAVQDSRLHVVDFAKAHPRYQLQLVSDPDIADDQSAISRFFAGGSVPRTAILDGHGRVASFREGPYHSLDELLQQVDSVLKREPLQPRAANSLSSERR